MSTSARQTKFTINFSQCYNGRFFANDLKQLLVFNKYVSKQKKKWRSIIPNFFDEMIRKNNKKKGVGGG